MGVIDVPTWPTYPAGPRAERGRRGSWWGISAVVKAPATERLLKSVSDNTPNGG